MLMLTELLSPHRYPPTLLCRTSQQQQVSGASDGSDPAPGSMQEAAAAAAVDATDELWAADVEAAAAQVGSRGLVICYMLRCRGVLSLGNPEHADYSASTSLSSARFCSFQHFSCFPWPCLPWLNTKPS